MYTQLLSLGHHFPLSLPAVLTICFIY